MPAKPCAKRLAGEPRWRDWFEGFESPFGFHSEQDYEAWLRAEGLNPIEVRLVDRVMTHTREKFAAWIRTAWLPYTQRVPESSRDGFVAEFVDRYLERCPPASDGTVHVKMVRLDASSIKA